MTREERRQKLVSFDQGPVLLRSALREFPRSTWLYRPAPDRLCIHDIIWLLADSETHGYIRCRRIIAEPGCTLQSYDQQTWAKFLGYFHQGVKEALAVITALRRATSRLIVTLPESVWFNAAHNLDLHSTTLEQWLDYHEHEIPRAIRQMQDNYDDWLKINRPAEWAQKTKDLPPPKSRRNISAAVTLLI
jgi:hypothetical protein